MGQLNRLIQHLVHSSVESFLFEGVKHVSCDANNHRLLTSRDLVVAEMLSDVLSGLNSIHDRHAKVCQD